MTERIRLAGITKRYGTLLANDRVNLVLKAGEIHALLGENGAGKSTLVKILYGLVAPDEGEIVIEGENVTLNSPREARARGIGMVFQHFQLFEDFTALENIAIPLTGERAGGGLRERAREKAARFGLAIDFDRPVHTLSAGERQRIEILRALMLEPKVLVLDEPTSVLTPAESEALFLTLDKLAGEGTAILFISHKLEEVRRLCPAATILRQGRVVAEVDPRAMSARGIATLMVGEGFAELRPAREHQAGTEMLACEALCVVPESIHGVVLEGITFAVRAGEIVVIAGIAGNGQSELYAAISGEGGGVTGGAIRIDGRDVTRADINARRRAGAAFVPEARLGQATLPDATLSENIVLSWHATGAIGAPFIDRAKLRAISANVMNRFDVRGPKGDPRARELSGGNLQKYIVGREVERAPKLIVIDQPSWGVDARASTRIRQTLIDLASAGTAVLVITQDLDEALEIADRIHVMNDGRLNPPISAREADRGTIGLQMTHRDTAGDRA